MTGINKVLKEAAENAGSYPNSTYLRDSNGDPYQVFNMVAEEKDASGNVIDNFSIENIVIIHSFLFLEILHIFICTFCNGVWTILLHSQCVGFQLVILLYRT